MLTYRIFSAFALVCFTGTLYLSAQNLVVNPSFEEHLACPNAFTVEEDFALELVPGWTTPNASSDYFHTCGDDSYGVPINLGLNYQAPRTGEAYVGTRYWLSVINYNEYLEGTFEVPLQKDSFYLVEFFAALSDYSRFGHNEFSVLFTDTLFWVDIGDFSTGEPIVETIIIDHPHLTNDPDNFITSQEE